MAVLVALSVVAVARAAERAMALRARHVVPAGLSTLANDLWHAGNFGELESICRADKSVLGRVLLCVVLHRTRPYDEINLAAGDVANLALKEHANTSLPAGRWAPIDRLVRGPEELARQRARSTLAAYHAELDAELESYRRSLVPKRVFLGSTSGVSWFFVDGWYVMGPFDNSDRAAHALPFPPETLLDLDAVYPGKDGRAVRWRYVRSTTPAVTPPDDVPYAIHYASTELRSDRERAVRLAVGADDSMELWLNGELLFTSEAHLKPWVLAEGFVPAVLRAGYNSLLVRLENAPQGSAFSVLVRTAP